VRAAVVAREDAALVIEKGDLPAVQLHDRAAAFGQLGKRGCGDPLGRLCDLDHAHLIFLKKILSKIEAQVFEFLKEKF